MLQKFDLVAEALMVFSGVWGLFVVRFFRGKLPARFNVRQFQIVCLGILIVGGALLAVDLLQPFRGK